MAEWTLSAEQFAALWYSPAHDRMPFPFRFRSRFAYVDEYDRFRQDIQKAVKAPQHEKLRRALFVLATPDARLEVFGFTAGNELRHIACTRANNAVLATQTPAPDGGNIRLTALPTQRVAETLAAAVPVDRPGHSPARRFTRTDLESDAAPYTSAAHTIPARRQYQRLTRTADTGTIHISDGPRHGNPVTRRLRWFDIPDDGCYLEKRSSTEISVTPGAQDEIRRYLDSELRRVQPSPDGRRR